MGPRKNNAAAAGKDDSSAVAKMRKLNPTGPHTTSGSSSSGKHVSANVAAADVGYTSEERAFLESQLSLFHSYKSNAGANTSGAAAGADLTSMTQERWMAGLPLLLSATEKLLHVAAGQYGITCKNRAAAAAQRSGGGAGSPPGPSASTREKDTSFSDVAKPMPNSGHSTLSITDAVLPELNADLPAPRPTPAAGTAAQFAEENAYILSQAQQLQWYPFTYQRWLELLLDPGKYHTAKNEGRLRGDVIQASLRRCILVTYPIVDGGDCN
ncbi:hypothetical protein ABL78_3647 [Leptomonas seymouri]|uniref:Uncharacterized protein n=1 Tax=Leptomonas seymouri TaxID=5684 RepID=A0A0N1HXL9_LEPSE|nr:hypothetical protein ABL78_3647 [Leptomonas seymouri]|eukprot:KPI87252.1 hypothetical protein ABL78_3647 [Leptomonas seymouri]